MTSEVFDHSRKIAIAAFKKNSMEKVGYVEYVENRGVAICPNIQKAKPFSEPETGKILQFCRKSCPDFDFLEFRVD